MTQPGKDLYFELELVSISDGPKIDTMAKMDSNEDGKVDKKEYSSYEKQIKAHIYDHLIKTNKMKSAQILEEEIASEVFYAFKEHDKNGDGFLSKREFRYWHDELWIKPPSFLDDNKGEHIKESAIIADAFSRRREGEDHWFSSLEALITISLWCKELVCVL